MQTALTPAQRFDDFMRSDGYRSVYSSSRGVGLFADTLACMYDEDWVARRAVEIWPTLALRQGFKIKDDKNDKILKEWQRLNHTQFAPEGLFRKSRYQGRLYGGAALLPVTRQGDMAQPWKDGEEVIAFDTFRRDELFEVTRDPDKSSPTFGQITLYEVSGIHARARQQIHASRLILAPGMNRETRYNFGGMTSGPNWPWISCLLPIWKALEAYNCTWDSVSRLISEASIGVLKVKGLLSMLAGTDQAKVMDRLSTMKQAIRRYGYIALDGGGGADSSGEESFTRTDVRFNSIPELLVQYCTAIAGAVDCPAAVFFGMSPAGLNATGEFDTRNLHERVQSCRTQEIGPPLARALSMVARREVEIEWPNLFEPTAKEAEELRLARLTGDRTIVDMGGASGADLVKARIEDGTLGVELDEADAKDPFEDTEADPADPDATIDPATGEALPGGPDVQATALNGAQSMALVDIVVKYHAGEIPRESAKEAILISFPNVDPERAERALGPEDFEPVKPEPKTPFGAPAGGAPPNGQPPTPKGPAVKPPPQAGNPPE